MGHHQDLNCFTSSERKDLVNLMLPYLTDAVVAAHVKIVHFGEQTFIGHSAYIGELEGYLLAEAGNMFVPLPQWDPADPIPEEFNVVKAQDDGTERAPLVNLNPGMPLPEQFVVPRLCEYRDADTLGNEINPWHIHVHTTVGGTLGEFRIASAAPIFWCFHMFVSEVYHEWQRSCSK
jgi:hypothetical protein